MPSVDPLTLPESARTLRQALPIEALELLDYPRELSDAAHEFADGHHDTIYTYSAHRLLLDGCTSSELAEAEEEAEDCGSLNGKGYHEIASVLAYFVHRARFETLMREALTAYREALDDCEATTDAEQDALDAEQDALATILG